MAETYRSVQDTASGREGQQASTSQVIDQLSRFDGPPEEFIVALLSVQCDLSGAAGGAILRFRGERAEVVAVWPTLEAGQPAPVWLAIAGQSAGEVAKQSRTLIRPIHEDDSLYGQEAKRNLALIPLAGGQGLRGFAAFAIESPTRGALERAVDRLEVTSSLLSLYEMRLTLQRRQGDISRLRAAMEILAAVNDATRFKGAAMAFCNEVSARWGADRVAVGLLKGRYVKLQAMSDTEKFDRKTESVQKLEAAMEECLDQDVEVLYPSSPESTYVCRATKEVSDRYGPFAMISLPLRREREVVGVVTLERRADHPLTLEEVEAIRLTCDLSAARMVDLSKTDRWFGARAASATRSALAKVLSPKHTWVKLIAILLIAAVVFLAVAKGTYVSEGSFVVQSPTHRVISAKTSGDLREVFHERGDRVRAGETLARLDTGMLEQELADALANRQDYLVAAEDARSKGGEHVGEAQVLMAKVKAAEARIAILRRQIADANITSPIDGTVVEGELERLEDKLIEKGQQLYQVADLSTLRAEIAIPEDQIAEVEQAYSQARARGEDLTGELSAKQFPHLRVGFKVREISPVATQVENQNVYQVRVELDRRPEWMMLGMEGVAQVHIGRRSYVYIWTRKLVNWVRMKLWI